MSGVCCSVSWCVALATHGEFCSVHVTNRKFRTSDESWPSSAEMVECKHCEGNGNCPKCDGDGESYCRTCDNYSDCHACDGFGDCHECEGTGKVQSGHRYDTYAAHRRRDQQHEREACVTDLRRQR